MTPLPIPLEACAPSKDGSQRASGRRGREGGAFERLPSGRGSSEGGTEVDARDYTACEGATGRDVSTSFGRASNRESSRD